MTKENLVLKGTFFAAIVLVAIPTMADILDMPIPKIGELHRIGHEIVVYTTVVAAAVGGAVVRYLAKKNWRVGDKWNPPLKRLTDTDDVETVTVAVKTVWADEPVVPMIPLFVVKELTQKVEAVLPELTMAFRKKYEQSTGMLLPGWEVDFILSILERDDKLLSLCDGIPIECLAAELQEKVRQDMESRLAAAFPYILNSFSVTYAKFKKKWFMMESIKRKVSCTWRLFKRKSRFPWLEERRERRRIKKALETLCDKSLDFIMESDPELIKRCVGVERSALMRALCKNIGELHVLHPIGIQDGHEGIVLDRLSLDSLRQNAVEEVDGINRYHQDEVCRNECCERNPVIPDSAT